MFNLRTFVFAVCLSWLSHYGYAQHTDHLHYVNPFIGTTRSGVATKWGSYGGTYPGAVAPSGAVQLSPETRVSKVKGYDYIDSSIYYFSCFRHSSGFPEGSAGRFFVMPVASVDDFDAGHCNRPFSHRNEVAHPGYYKVTFDDNHTIVEATASTRTGMFRFTFPPNVVPRIFIGDAGEITMLSKRVLHASHGHTVIDFGEEYLQKTRLKDGWIFTFTSLALQNKIIVFKLSKSSVGFENTQRNIDQEIGQLDFNEVYKRTRQRWAQKLSVVDVNDCNEPQKMTFYTALYHSLLIPWIIDDVDGRYRGSDGEVYKKSGKNEYGKFSPWDTFRSLNPLLSLLYPDKENDVILSMLDMYRQTGHLPAGAMTGNHAVPIIVDSYLKGITGFDKTLAYAAMKKSIADTPFIQPDMEAYLKRGYVPYLYAESVTRTVEYAYDDWALSQFARYVVDNRNDYKRLLDEGYNYRNLFNAQELLLLPRSGSNFMLNPGNAGYKEGSKWTYSYFVPQNGRDLINLMGGNAAFAKRLDSAFSNGLIIFDNETTLGLPYLFNQALKPSLTQKWCKEIMLKRYTDHPGGLPGNDDLGAMSSWYVFSAMGIYPVCPGRPLYAIGSPLFHKVILHLSNGKVFVINGGHCSLKEPFIRSLTVNGKNWQRLTISHSLLLNGGSMTFNMGRNPGEWLVNEYPADLSETRRKSKIEILNYSIAKRSVAPNEPFFVYFSLINKGSVGTKTVKLLVNGKKYAYKNCLVASGQLKKDSIQCRLYPVGKVILELEGRFLFTISVKQPETGKSFPFRITRLSAKPIVKQHEMQRIEYSIQNTGGYKHVFHVPLIIDDSVVLTDSVAIDPGATKNIIHLITAQKEGINLIRVDSATERVKVYNNNLSSLLLDLPTIEYAKDDVIKDRSGFHNNGYVTGADTAKIESGDRVLLGRNCFVEMKNSESLDSMGPTITIMAWVYPTRKGKGLAGIFTKGDNDVLQVSNGKTLSFFAGGWGRGSCTVSLPSDWVRHWHHVTGVCTGEKLHLYIDGMLRGTTVLERAVNLSNSNKWYLGRNQEFPEDRIFYGYIDRVKIFEAPLKEEEIRSIIRKERTLTDD